MSTTLKYYLALDQIKPLNPINFKKIIDYFPNIVEAWQADLLELKSAGLAEKLAHQIIIQKKQINPDQELEKIHKENIQAITINDPNYPLLLKQIYDPPIILYYQGTVKALKSTCLAVVGARKYSAYGRQAVTEIAGRLANQNITIVSGLALGIDALSHQSCLEAGGQTIAVLGSSVDNKNISPATNQALAQKIINQGGVVISEYPLYTSPHKQNFPARNRIISGLCQAVIVIEAQERSGTLITARLAAEQGRNVFAIPGSIYNPTSRGTNELIKKGAILATSAEDILEVLNLRPIIKPDKEKTAPLLSSEERKIISLLTYEPTHIDKLAQSCNIKVNVLLSALTSMELKGLIKDLGGKNYIKK